MPSAWTQSSPRSIAAVTERGSALEEKGDLGVARALYEDGLKHYPASRTLHFHLGTLALREEKWGEAIEQLKLAGQRDPEALFYLAQAYNMNGELTSAVQSIERAAKLAPDNAAITQKLGQLLCETPACDQGLLALDRARRLDPSLPHIDFEIGMAQYRLKNLERARGGFERALRRDSADTQAAFFLAETLTLQSEWAQARRQYEACARANPGDAKLWYGLGRALVALEEYQSALAPLRRALELNPALIEAHFQMGRALKGVGRDDEGGRELQLFALARQHSGAPSAVSTVRTPKEEAVWSKCRDLLEAGEEAHALRYLGEQSGTTASAPYLLGALYYSMGRGADAKRLFEQALVLQPKDARVLAYLGRTELEAGALNQAERRLRQALEIDPADELALAGLGELRYRQGRWDEAIEQLKASRTREPRDLLLLCDAYLRSGQREQALLAAELVRMFSSSDAKILSSLEHLLHE